MARNQDVMMLVKILSLLLLGVLTMAGMLLFMAVMLTAFVPILLP